MINEPDPMLTGAAFELANAGYKPMPGDQSKDQEEIGGDTASLREAADKISAPQEELVVRQYRDHEGKPAAANEAITLARASRDYSELRAAEQLVADSENAKELAARIDALRAEALSKDPDAAELYGLEIPAAEGAEDKAEKSDSGVSSNQDELPISELDPELEKALRHPQVRHAIDEQVAEVEKARQGYLDGLAAATQIAQASFVSQFPELVGIAPENMPAALEHLSRQDPVKFARVQATVATSEQLFAQQRQEVHRQAEIARENFLAFAKSEDARLETMLKGEPRETQRAVTEEILASAKASGIEADEFMRLFNSEPLMRNATFQRMMYDAGKYRLMMRAKEAAATKPLPPVQRPGAATTRAEREHADLRTLSAKLSSTGDIKDAVALYHARKSSRRR
jgi:hypothetical protein